MPDNPDHEYVEHVLPAFTGIRRVTVHRDGVPEEIELSDSEQPREVVRIRYRKRPPGPPPQG